MRLTTNQIYSNGLNAILESQKKLVRAQDTIIKQTNLLKPSDDPAAATKVIRMEEDIQRLAQFEKNSVSLKNTLENKDTILSNINSTLDRSRVLAVQAGSGANSFDDRKAIAAEISLLQDQMVDMLNSKTAQGDYLFSGDRSSQPPFILDGNRSYIYQGSEVVKDVQIAENIKISAGVSGSGFAIFENIDSRNSVTIGASSVVSVSEKVDNLEAFENFHDSNYVKIPPNPAGSNTYTVSFGPGTYDIQDSGGTSLQNGTFGNAGKVHFNGLEFSVDASTGGSFEFTLEDPQKKNILNALDDFVTTLSDPAISGDDYFENLRNFTFSVDQTLQQVGVTQSEIGGRINVVDRVNESNAELSIDIKSAKAKVSEVDFAAAVTELQKQETALQAAQQTFSKVTALSLFNYLR